MTSSRHLLLLVLLLFGPRADAQRMLHRSADYSIAADRVVQGAAVATALSTREIVSTYRSPYRVPTRSVVDLRFSINGFDNERVVGQNHRIALPVQGGAAVSPLYVFGEADSVTAALERGGEGGNLAGDADLLVRLDLRHVLRDFARIGETVTATGQRIRREEFRGVYLAGGVLPLTWNFSTLLSNASAQLTDPDGDSIYTLTVHFAREQTAEPESSPEKRWSASRDLSAFPVLHSPFPLLDALYVKALDEMLENVRPDGAFMAGAMWPGVWTRDISYSIILSLAAVHPDASKASLLAKVKDGRIIQDTGTGGSWPVSSDRMVWGLAAWEIYTATGDRAWLERVYPIIKASADDDVHTVYDPAQKLYRGESSFLDWREQTYPRWMDPKDIYASLNLGTNVVHARSLEILGSMSAELGLSAASYRNSATALRRTIDAKFWLAEKKYYGQYLYGRGAFSLSPRSESLGEALAVLYGVASPARAQSIVSSTPITRYGIPCVQPQSPGLPPYHNNAVWPFVEAYWGWASAKSGNSRSVEEALASIIRASALFVTNKENFVATTGDYMGTEINSGRQLWSLAGMIAAVHRVLFGMEFTPEGLAFRPFVPQAYAGTTTLSNFRYRGAVLDVTLEGFGSTVVSAKLDGKPLKRAVIPGTITGRHTLVLRLSGRIEAGKVNMCDLVFAPDTPVTALRGDTLAWRAIEGADRYLVVWNGVRGASVKQPAYRIPSGAAGEYQVAAVAKDGTESFLSEPVAVHPADAVTLFESEDGREDAQATHAGFTGKGYVMLSGASNEHWGSVAGITKDGTYRIDFRYANGNGPINTDNKCAIRTLVVDGEAAGVIVLPQRGTDVWNDWGYSSAITVPLSAGKHSLELRLTPPDRNMNGDTNAAAVDHVRLTRVGPKPR